MTFKERFHYGTACGVQKETILEHLTFVGRKNEVQMIFEASEKN